MQEETNQEEEKIGFETVLPIESQALLIMQWRNDPLTLRMSYHSQPKIWGTFYREFQDQFFSLPDLPPFFILREGRRAGFVKFNLVEHPEKITWRRCCEISINLAPEFRGKGIGTTALKLLKQWVASKGYDDLYAEAKEENIASHNAFLKAGFSQLDNIMKKIDTEQFFLIKRFLARLTPEMKQTNQNVFVIAEAGSNWRMGSERRDIAMAKTLIDIAVEAGANAVKFQTFRPETVYAKGAGKSDYLGSMGIEDDILDLFADLAMPYEIIPLLAEYCQKQQIEFMSSPFSKSDFHAVDRFVKRHKIASYEITHLRLIELAAHSGKPVIMSTGAANEEEIAWAVQTFRNHGGKELTLLQCTARYPAEANSMNLNVIPWLKHRFKVSVGLSDHSRHPVCAPLAAVALGATVIEKHFTLNNRLVGPDHAFALTPGELIEMVHAIRRVEKMLGSGVKTIQPEEEELRDFARRGVQALREINKGDIFQEGQNIEILRPGKQPMGVHPKYLPEIQGKKAMRSIPIGNGIMLGDWEVDA